MANKLTNFVGEIFDTIARAIARAIVGGCNVAAVQFVAEPRKGEFAPYREPRRLTVAEQWNYLTDVITGATSRAEEATRCQASAALQLDLAQYALTTLVDELSAVMDMQGRRKRATIHVLEVAPVRAFGDAIAA
jgi:hypothetical protein